MLHPGEAALRRWEQRGGMDHRTHRISSQAQREPVTREIAWTIRSVLMVLARAGTRQPELIPVRVERDPRYR
ncbi:MAG: hypothetical protein NVS1B1_12360 [Candidatus Limnocylindrales bacterium]